MRVAGFFVREAVLPWQPPSYADSSAFRELDVTVGEPPWELPGTLTLPRGDGPFPVAVLVHGSGPQDRDETVGPNKPLKDLAWGLASAGVAALRYDKRTLVHGAAMGDSVTLDDEVVEDALAALALARTRARVDSSRAVLIGHSLGAMLAPEIARRDGGLAGVALLAAPARPFVMVLRSQLEYVRSLSPAETRATHDSLLAMLDRYQAGDLDPDATLLGAPVAYWDELVALDPVGTLLELEVPALILQGGRDYQSTTEDLERWRAELRERPAVTTRVYPALNHFFAEGRGRATPAEYTGQAGHVAAEVVDDVAAWILELPGVARVPLDPGERGELPAPGAGPAAGAPGAR
jgi:hypothetical protein